jgi:hypothetical protein
MFCFSGCIFKLSIIQDKQWGGNLDRANFYGLSADKFILFKVILKVARCVLAF